MNRFHKFGFAVPAMVVMLSFSAAASHHGSEHHENEHYENVHYEEEHHFADEITQDGYICISQEEAHAWFEENEEACIVDVREPEEYEESHIPGAILLPLGEIEEQCAEVLPDMEADIFIYCRSGRRSKLASELLADLGYTHVYEFGGLMDWVYETEAGPYIPTETEGDILENGSCEAEICETEACDHEWLEDCTSKTCSKCGEYHRITP